MLATTNPGAVDEIDANRDRRRPYVGQRVIYHSRPGESRFGRQQAIADVLHIVDDDMVELLVTYAADDSLIRVNIPRRTDQNPFNSWSFTEYDEENYLPSSKRDKLAQAIDDIAALRNKVRELSDENTALAGRASALESAARQHPHRGNK